MFAACWRLKENDLINRLELVNHFKLVRSSGAVEYNYIRKLESSEINKKHTRILKQPKKYTWNRSEG